MQNYISHKPAIVIPAYKRGKALQLLLKSLNEACYEHNDIDLILSLEYEADQEVLTIAEDFEFVSGQKTILQHTEKLGLKNHIIKCADLSEKYGSVIILEEDLIVSPAFFHYSVEALNRYGNDDSIGGISLYAQRFNETAQLPFEPMPSPDSVYFMQLTSSWGQAWSSKQWQEFKMWCKKRDQQEQYCTEQIPENIKQWPESSWKKQFNCYLSDTGKYFVYPYQSLSSNNSHFGGENMKQAGNLFQVPLMSFYSTGYYKRLPVVKNAYVIYDAFMEPSGRFIEEVTGISRDELEVDFYGTKPQSLLKSKTFFITSNSVSRAMEQFPLRVKPIEQNVRYPLPSNEKGFFSMAEAETSGQIKDKNNRYITLAQYFSYNRVTTKRFIFGNLVQSFFLKRKK